MSGTAFAQTAASLAHAEDVQNALARIRSESDIIPAIDDVPEGLSKQAFTEQYGRVDSDAYSREVKRLKQRIKRIPLYAN